MGKNTLVVTISLIASAALGFVSQILFADKFGASEDMDLHFRILAIPSMVTGTSSVIFASIFIPLLSKLRLNSKEYYEYIKGTWLVVFAFGIFFIAVTATTSAAYVRPVHDVSSTQLRHLIAQMSVLIAIGSGFSLMSGYISAVLNSNKEFYHVAWTSVLPALLIIISVLFLHEELGVRSISLGYAIGFFLQFIVLKYKAELTLEINAINITRISGKKRLLTQSVLVFVSLLPFSITPPIAYYWAADLGAGSISYIGYSLAFSGFLSVAVSMGVSIVSLPDLAADFANKREDSALQSVEQNLRVLLLVAMFFSGLLVALREEVIRLFYLKGSFDSESILEFADLVVWFLLSAVFVAGLNLLRTLIYSRMEYLKISVLGATFPIIFFGLAGVLKESLALVGIGVANLISYAVLFVLTVYIARDRNVGFLSAGLYNFMARSSLAAAIPTLTVFFSAKTFNLHIGLLANILLNVILYAVIYVFVAIRIFKLTETENIVKKIHNQLKLLWNVK